MRTSLGLAFTLALSGIAAAGASAAEVTLNAASCFPVGSPVAKPFQNFIEAVNKAGKGQIQLKLVGGAPAIGSPFTLTQKMAAGAYDLVGCPEAYVGNVVPEVPALRFAEKSYGDLRKNGAIDYMEKLFNAKNIHFLARYHDFGPFYLWLNKEISKPDLTGLHLRVSPVYTAFFKSLGATTQTSNIAQIYTYMENNTVQGYGWPSLGYLPSWVKVTKYRVEPGFYNATLHVLVNNRKWKSLNNEQRAIMSKIAIEMEKNADPDSETLKSALKKQRDWMTSQGMKIIEFKGADRKKWLDAAREQGWAEVIQRSPKHGPALKKLFTQ